MIGVGEGITKTNVGVAGILVLVGVAEGIFVEVVVGVNVGVLVGQMPFGTEIFPAALAHNL